MIVGNGLMASVFVDEYMANNNYIIFASGVSYSLETDVREFKREENLLTETLLNHKDKRLIYFTSFIDSNIQKRKYTQHKLNMESHIINSKNSYLILKLPQIIGHGGNDNLLINFISRKLKNNEEIVAYKDTFKSLIDVGDVKRIVNILLKQRSDKYIYVEIPYIEKLLVCELIELVAEHYHIIPKIKLVDSGVNDLPELSLMAKTILGDLNIKSNGYTKKAIKKYI